jgi:hypothetical protein
MNQTCSHLSLEQPTLIACIDALQPFGDVLQIGFGSGCAANHIQAYRPLSHTIIEADPAVAQRARRWAKDYSNVRVVEKNCHLVLPQLKLFDVIFLNDHTTELPQLFDRCTTHMRTGSCFAGFMTADCPTRSGWIEKITANPDLHYYESRSNDVLLIVITIQKAAFEYTNSSAHNCKTAAALSE